MAFPFLYKVTNNKRAYLLAIDRLRADEKMQFPHAIFLWVTVSRSHSACKRIAKNGACFFMSNTTNTTEERKQSFIMYNSHKAMFTESSPEQCQELIGRIFDFAETGEKANDITDPLVKICYDQITFLMDRNMKAYTKACQRKSQAKKKWWEEHNTLEELEKKIKESEGNAKEQLKYIEEYRRREAEMQALEEDAEKLPFD